MYYGWFDDNPKLSAELKIQDAVAAYMRRFGKRPNIVLVNEADIAEITGMTVRPEHFIRRNNFWVGYEDVAKGIEPIVVPTATPVVPVAEVAASKRAPRKTAKMAA